MLESDIKISVIIPVYNVEKYLKKCIDSILNQTFQDFEIIFIDDGSTDKSLKILEEYNNRDNRFIILKQTHKGAGTARNKGIELARGKYVIFLDSDDYFEPTLLEELFHYAEDNKTEITICSSRKVDDYGIIIETESPNFPINFDKIPMKQIFNWENFKEDIFCLLAPVIWNRLFLKDFLINNDLRFPNLPIYEDIGFVHCTTASATKMIAFNKELNNIRDKVLNDENLLPYLNSKEAVSKNAPIFENADIGIVGDLFNVLMDLIENIDKQDIILIPDPGYASYKEMVKVFRPPKGEFDRQSLMSLNEMGYKTVFWSIAFQDWSKEHQKGKEYSYNSVINNLHDGAIILMHTVSTSNSEALPDIIDEIRNQGYEFDLVTNL